MTLQIGSEAPDFEADTAESASGSAGCSRRVRGLARKAARPPTTGRPATSASSGAIIADSVSDGEAKTTYPGGWKAPKPYLRLAPQPRA